MIKGWVTGETKLRGKFEKVPDTVKKELQVTVRKLMNKLRSDARGLAPSLTGKLKRSIRANMKTYPDAVIARVYTNVFYAHFYEYGFSGGVKVKAHIRTIREVFGNQIRGGFKVASVRTYMRQVNSPVRSFMRWSLMEMGPTIKQELGDVVLKSVTETLQGEKTL